MNRLARGLFRAARAPVLRGLMRWIVGGVFQSMSWILPVDRLRETATLIAFYHPRPSYPFHVLIVPKRDLGDIRDLTTAQADFMADLFQTAQSLVDEFGLEAVGYRLITNGGRYQDVPHLHFHLIAETEPPASADK